MEDTKCYRCEEQLTDEEIAFPLEDASENNVCEECWHEEYEDYCFRCHDLCMKTELEANPGELIAVWHDIHGAYNTCKPGYYRVRRWPIYRDGMIEGHLIVEHLQYVSDLNEVAPCDYLAGPLCHACQTDIRTDAGARLFTSA